MRNPSYLMLPFILSLASCSYCGGVCVNKDNHTQIYGNKESNFSSDCTVTYSDSRRQTIDLPKNCRSAIVLNSGSGNLIIRSSEVLDFVNIINSGSNNANLTGIKAKRVVLHDRGSGNLLVSSIEEITGFSYGSGTVIIQGPGKNSVVNKGSGTILGQQF